MFQTRLILLLAFVLTSYFSWTQTGSTTVELSKDHQMIILSFDSITGGLVEQQIVQINLDGEAIYNPGICYNEFIRYNHNTNTYIYSDEYSNKWYSDGKPKAALKYLNREKLELIYSEYDREGGLISEKYFYHAPDENIFFAPTGNWWRLDEKGNRVNVELPYIVEH